MVQSTKSRTLTDIDRDLEAAVRDRPPAREPRYDDVAAPRVSAPALAIPEYVEHQDGATEIGRLSAEAVVREFEAAAKEIEAMGAELIERVKQCEAMTRNAFTVSEELKEAAARYREEAKRIFNEIENCSQMTAEVRKTCTELKQRIAIPSPDVKVPAPGKE